MYIRPRPDSPTHELPGASFTSLATPTTGSFDTAVWEVQLTPGHAPTTHALTRQEVFIITAGQGLATIAGDVHPLTSGDVLVVPAHTAFSLQAGPGGELVALCCFPTDGKGMIGDAEPFTPPWAQ